MNDDYKFAMIALYVVTAPIRLIGAGMKGIRSLFGKKEKKEKNSIRMKMNIPHEREIAFFISQLEERWLDCEGATKVEVVPIDFAVKQTIEWLKKLN